MKKIEIIIAAVSVIALVLSILSVPYAKFSAHAIFTIYSMFYWLFSFALLNNIRFRDIFKKEAYKGVGWKRIVGAICTGYALSLVIIGILFKIMSFPGAGIMLLLGVGYLCIIAIVAIVKYVQTRSQFYVGVLVRIAIIGGLGLVSFFLF